MLVDMYVYVRIFTHNEVTDKLYFVNAVFDILILRCK